MRLIGALLAAQNEIWLERIHLDIQKCREWAAAFAAAREGDNVIALSGKYPIIINQLGVDLHHISVYSTLLRHLAS